MAALTSPRISKNKQMVGKFLWPDTESSKQYFSLPSSIIYYMTMNPPITTSYSKMIQLCKYFFEKNPILVARKLLANKLCLNEPKKCEFLKDDNDDDESKCCTEINIHKTYSRIWLTHCLALHKTDIPNFISVFQQKFYCYEGIVLGLYEISVLLSDFKMLASAFKNICIMNSQITYENGSPAMIDKIIEAMPDVEKFEYYFDLNAPFTADSMRICKLKDIKHLKKLQSLALLGIPEIIDVDDLRSFINAHKDVTIELIFDDRISDNYENQLVRLHDTFNESSKCRIHHLAENFEVDFTTMFETFCVID